jgi:hypothetical protein
MDATRTRRTRGQARQRWYASCRCRRFARFLTGGCKLEQGKGAKLQPGRGSPP